jgi:hypothetical protein
MFVILKTSLEGVLMSFVALSKIIRSPSTVLVLLLWLSSDAVAQRKPDFTEALNVARVSAPLTSAERALAVKLGEQALRSNKLFTDRKMYLTDLHIHRDTASEMKGVFERLAVLIYYRYEGSLAIEVFINLTRQQVLAVKQLPKLTPPISPEELTLAQEMALNHPQVRDAVEPYRDRLIVEALTPRSESPKDPLFRHRLVYLMFRVGPSYLMWESRVFVDLTTEKVIIEPAPKKMRM